MYILSGEIGRLLWKKFVLPEAASRLQAEAFFMSDMLVDFTNVYNYIASQI